jgi:HK97 family phage major capsid protein/HK97 family phage prohead protease
MRVVRLSAELAAAQRLICKDAAVTDGGQVSAARTRAYSVLEIKTLNEGDRVLTGIATSPTPDRLGDIVEPLGVQFKNPLPLLWQHRSAEPIGTVRFDKPTKDGITFTAKIAKVDEPGRLKDRVDEAWQTVKAGLVRAVSIGFRAIEMSFMDDGGIRFIESEVLELSLVTIPAQQDALIETIRSIDTELRAASGQTQREVDKPPGVTGKRNSKSLAPKDARPVKTIAEQIAAFEASREAKSARMTALMEKAAEASQTLDEAESEEYDTLEAEVKSIDAHLVRLAALDKQNKAAAKPVGEVASPEQASEVRRGSVITVQPNVPKGTAFTRYAIAVLRGAILRRDPLEIARAEKSWHNTPEVMQALSVDIPGIMKAAVGAGTTTDVTWAAPLIAFQVMADEFIGLLRPATIIGRIPGLRRVPFNIQMPRTTTGSSVGWVGENAPKPVSAMAFDTVTLRWAKAAGIVILTDELVRFSNPSAENVVRQDLIDAMAQFLDRQFVDPAVAVVTNVSPASITNGVTPVTATGATAAAFRADAKTLLGSFFTNNFQSANGVWIMTQGQALAFSLMMTSLGTPLHPNITAEGGTLIGYPVVTSENIPATGNSPLDGFPIIFAKASEIMLADDGQVVIDASREASVQMDSAPDSPPTASSNMVSLWQMNMTGLRAERWINWQKRRATAVVFIQNAKYAE